MKAEVGYQDIVMGAFIEDLIDSIKWNMKSVRISVSTILSERLGVSFSKNFIFRLEL